MMFLRFTFMRAALGALLLGCLIVAASPAAAQKEWTVHLFRFNGSQGAEPNGGLIVDSDGTLYGTTSSGGAYNSGTVYELVRPVPPKTGWTLTVLYSFTGADGANPEGGLVLDSVGNLYGTTENGGLTGCNNVVPGCGVVFELSPPAIAGNTWTESVLHSFSAPGNGDGSVPSGELIRDGSGSLYGVTNFGSADQNSPCEFGGCGTVFELSPPITPGGAWAEAILHSFALNQQNSESTLVLDSQGDLYGSAGGGKFERGVVYRLLRPATTAGTWTYQVLHTFGPVTSGSREGAFPETLTLHGKRVIYGTTYGGGLYGEGTVFQLVPPTVAGSAWTENVLYSFRGGGDADAPLGKLIFDSTGNMYGVTFGGGLGGAVFKLTPPTSSGPWIFTVLHFFSETDGADPRAGLVFGKNGVLFGATQFSTDSKGAVFGLLP